MNLVAFPLYQQNLCLFASHLALSTSISNIKVHLAALKFFALIHGYMSELPSFHQLYLVLRGIKKTLGNKYKKKSRAPITPDILRVLKFNLYNSSIIYKDKVMIWAAMTSAFFGFLRVSEYTSTHVKSYDINSTLYVIMT